MASTSNPDEIKQVIVARSDLGMGRGKLAAQASHASLECFLKARKTHPEECKKWRESGMPKVAVKVNSEKELKEIFQSAKDMGIPASLICDAGKTQLEPGTYTCVGLGPAKSRELDKLTGKLKLL